MTMQRSFTDQERKELSQPAPGDRDAWQATYRTWKTESGQRSHEWEAVAAFMRWLAANPRRPGDTRIYSHEEILSGAYLRDSQPIEHRPHEADYDDSPEALGDAYSDV